MKILVGVKKVVDAYVKIRVRPDNTGVETQNVKMSMNPFDEIAVEEAVRLKEKNPAVEIVLVSIGPEQNQETLRHGLALGADRAILVKTSEVFNSLHVAKILQIISQKESPQLILLGKQSIDGDNNQTPQMLAGLLDWPQAMFASKIDCQGDTLEVTREIDGGLETLRLTLPAVVSTDLRLNEPRYASLPNIMKAKKKELEVIELSSLNLPLAPLTQVLAVNAPPVRTGGEKLDSVATLITKLKQEAKVL